MGLNVVGKLQEDGASLIPSGAVMKYVGVAAPSGWLLCNGASLSKTTYADLWAVLNTSKGAATISQASPGVVTFTSHGFVGGERIYFTTDGALPAGLAVDTTYWVTKVDADTFNVSSSFANYVAGTKINTSDAGSGTHTLVWAPFGVASSTNFLAPDLRGAFVRGAGTHGTLANANGTAFVGVVGVEQNDKMQGHLHGIDSYINNTGHGTGDIGRGNNGGTPSDVNSQAAVTDGTNGTPRTGLETAPVNIGLSYIIKT